MKRNILFISLLLTTLCAHAQHSSVCGQLLNGATSETIPYTNCVLLRQADSLFVTGCISDVEGHFCLPPADSGAYLLRVTAVGFRPYYRPVHLPADSTVGALQIFPSSTLLETVSVTAQRPLYSADGEKIFYHVGDDPGVQTSTAADALQNAPGVEVDAEGNITYRGSSNVDIWLNNRPSRMDSEALKQYLKVLPAGSIERIEVISNPSARYASGSPIVNIITNQKLQTNSLLCLGANIATTPSLQPWISYVYSNERLSLNLWANGGAHHFNVKVNSSEQYFDTTNTLSGDMAYQATETQTFLNSNVGFSLNYEVDSATVLSLWAGSWPGKRRQESDRQVSRHEYLQAPGDYGYHVYNETRTPYGGIYGGAQLQHQIDTLGQNLNIWINSNYGYNLSSRYSARDYHMLPHLDYTYQNDNRSHTLWSGMELLYTKPYSPTGQIETGGEVEIGNNRYLDTWDSLNTSTQQMQRDAVRTYGFHLHDYEVNAFLAVQQRMQQLTAKAGVRLYRKWKQTEYDHLPSPTEEYNVDKAFWDFIPSLHLSYATANNHNFTLSYTRRFMSPGASLWSPYVELGLESASMGNPDLRFSHTHNVEGGWTWYAPWGSLGLTGYLHANTDEVQQMSDVAYLPFYGRIVPYTQYRNIGTSHTMGSEANLTWRPQPFVNVRLYANLFDYGYRAEYRPGEWQDTHRVAFTSRLNVSAKVWNHYQIYANARYSSPQLSLLSESLSTWQVDVGVSADLLDRRLSLYFNINDIFHTNRNGSRSLNPYYSNEYSYNYNSFSATLGLTYRIGRMELESKARQGVSAPTL